MTGDTLIADGQYSTIAGFAFAFNVIMGNGPLALPAAFLQAGWLISTIVILILCATSFITFTFVVEAMSTSNAITRLKCREDEPSGTSQIEESPGFEEQETSPPIPLITRSFEIIQKFELGQMFGMYFGRLGNILFYINICVYLYGDLSIYAAGVPKSLRNVVCTATINATDVRDSDLCWTFSKLTRAQVYRIFVACFAALMLPFLFFHVTKSRWLQLLTTIIRWLSFLLMLCLAIDRAIVIRTHYPEPVKLAAARNLQNGDLFDPAVGNYTPPPIPNPPIIQQRGIPNLFGVCVYVFMCHHSIPGFVTPIRNKHRLMLKFYIPLFLSCVGFNLLLSGTALAAFDDIKDLYTLNFVPDEKSAESFQLPFKLAQVFGYFLSLFPVFALSSTFPILGCTLIGNLTVLFNMSSAAQSPRFQTFIRWFLPFLVLVPPICIALITDNIGFLVGFTGAVFGSGIQYIIPAVLVYRSRVQLTKLLVERSGSASPDSVSEHQLLCPDGDQVAIIESAGCCKRFKEMWNFRSSVHGLSDHASPFQHFAWIFFLLIWAVFCLVIVLVDKFLMI